ALDRTRTKVLETGTFSTLDNVVDTQTGTVRAKARFPNATQTLFPSQFVNVRLLLRTIEGAVAVPVTAVRHGSNGDFVYVLNSADRTVSLRTVTAGQQGADKVIVTAGLKPGETVITEGADRLKDGARVALPADATPAAGGARRSGERGGRPPGDGAKDAPGAPDGANARQGRPGGADTAKGAGDPVNAEGQRRRRSGDAPGGAADSTQRSPDAQASPDGADRQRRWRNRDGQSAGEAPPSGEGASRRAPPPAHP
ncbi:MAG: efflux RND transporter periplasmic adaptor subunit, partial [Pseudomonadota bacterium]|nr:efflux RND transporter periplasmic adaptor subunit [Pseudomonadota bacterium]